MEKIEIDHVNYPKSLRRKGIVELLYIIEDARKAIRAYPENPKAGYYADEINYASMEIARRHTGT